MSVSRNIVPAVKEIERAELLQPEKLELDNGIPFYALRSGAQPVLRLEFIFEAGILFQDKILTAPFTNSMLAEGTARFNAKQIAEQIDFYGAFLQPETDHDYASATLHCLSSSFTNVIDTLADIVLRPVFPEKELNVQVKNSRQKYLVNLEKTEYLARKNFNEALFGNQHPYGKQAEISDFEKINNGDLRAFFNKHYSPGRMTIIASGNFDETVFKSVNEYFGKVNTTPSGSEPAELPSLPEPKKIFIRKENAIQCGIRIGKVLIKKNHPDFAALQVVNTALGGYFGSRLMANIREDKGYTYGIGSMLVSCREAGYFFIATETGKDVCKNTLEEIYKEITLLQNEPMTNEELGMVKNYMLGSFLRHSEGPFAMADRFKSLHFSGLSYDYFDHYLDTIRKITAEEIRDIANKYLDIKSLTQVVAGPGEGQLYY